MTGGRQADIRGRIAVKRGPDRAARRMAACGYAAAAVIPVVLWHGLVLDLAQGFRLEAGYLVTGWTPWLLLAVGMLFMLPVAVSAGHSPGSRLYPRARNAYAGWGVSLYMLGFVLALQVAEVAGSFR